MRVIGLDVSKESVEVWCSPDNVGYSFKLTEVETAIEQFKKQQPELIVMESTGKYEQPWLKACLKAGLPPVVEHAARIHYHAKALGKKAKTDKLDAQVIAHYAQMYGERLKQQLTRPPPRDALKALVERREDLLKQQTAEKNRLKQATERSIQVSITQMFEFLGKALEQMGAAISALIEADATLTAQHVLLQTAPGVGEKTSWALLAVLPELGQVSPKVIAALAGVAPFQQESGQWRGRACIRGGRSLVRKALYMAILSSVRHCDTFKTFYTRLVEKGKPKKLALVACMHKMLRILNAMVAHNKGFSEA